MAFIVLEGFISFLSGLLPFLSVVAEFDHYIFYPLKIVLIGIILIIFWRNYEEMKDRPRGVELLISVAAGAVVFAIWINLDIPFASVGRVEGFNPFIFGSGAVAWTFVGIRLFGASVVVPVFEELFWRSFIIRYIVDIDFEKIPLGTFTWVSFIVTTIFFGLEHNLWLAGIIAGVVYALLLYRTKRLIYPIVSHGVTNLLLGLYVLLTGSWQFW